MKPLPRRRLLAAGGTTLAAMLLGRVVQAQAPREIAIEARRFVYTPSEITVKAGEPVVLLMHAIDFPHGFNLPDLKIRADLVPGQVVRVALPPMKAGTLDFLCDNFCGDGHEQMHGRIVVT